MRIMMFTRISMVLLFLNLFRIYVMHVSGQCLLDEKTVLLQIRSEITYNSWASTKLVLWDERVDCCHWPGLSCNDAGYISSLDLSDDDSITGGFNVSLLLKLPSLSVIRLDGISFSAPFPDFFEDFTNLTVLSLVNCNFTGTVPQKVFQVPTLQTINLNSNEMLGGSLPEFPENGSLQSLTLYRTKFSGNLPESIGNLRMLSDISLLDCNFSGLIPTSIGKLTKLVHLSFAGNHFSGSIPSFKLSKNLTVLDLSSNKFTGEIPSLKLFKNLTLIDLSSNKFTGEILSSHWDGLDNLEDLYLNNNSFSGPIPASLFSLPSLKTLDLSRNKFSGQIIDLQNVTSQLRDLDLSCNNLAGPIPSFFFQLRNLTSLVLSSNEFNGTVHLTKFRNLETLDISHNSLVVETSISAEELPFLPQFRVLALASCNLRQVPYFLKNQSRLKWLLDLSNNSISGEIPNWIWGIGNGKLWILNLSHNHFTHMQEPQEYGINLYYLDLHSNMLSGQIPRLPREALYLDLSSNNFTSIIPLDIGDQLPNVIFFSIANNRVSGRIPPSWCHAANLEMLDLSNNTLQGTIPSCLVQNNSNLGVINLKGNHLSGEIPQVFLQSCSLETLDLSQNILEGKLPPSLVNCTKLKVLNLGSNRISDTFPCWLNKLPNLHILVLRSNHFHGNISCPRLGVNNSSWPSLQVIDLSNNNFSGILPDDLFLELIAIVVDRNEAESKLDYLHFTSSGNLIMDYDYSVSLSLKGQSYNIEKVATIFTSIDFSSNQFEGSIPETVGELKLLHLLNFSHNLLTDNIPQSLGNLKALEALDLSFNKLTGNIPMQLEILTFLEFLNLSYNNLAGRIPRSTQLDTFDASSFMGNKGLRGFQLNVSCSGINEPASPLPELEGKQSSHHADIYISVALGFVAGLGGIFVPLLLSNKWRSYYNQKIEGILSKIFFQRGQGRRKKSR